MSECPGITEEEMKTTNGCGSSYWLAYIFRIPKWFSHPIWCACNKHDIKFQNCTTLDEKKIADLELIAAIEWDGYNDPRPFMRWLKLKIAEKVEWCLNTKLSERCFVKAKPKQFYFT